MGEIAIESSDPVYTKYRRRLPIGAEVMATGGVHFRVWAPYCNQVEVVLEYGPAEKGEGMRVPLEAEANGYFSGLVLPAKNGSLYRFRLCDGHALYPDPAPRFQPHGPHGPSLVIDPAVFAWADASWPGCGREGLVLYEMHIGTYTRDGTWTAAMRELPELANLGITLLEIMPVADFAGRYGWGYDGVGLFAPTRLYGGPDGNYLRQFSPDYFSDRDPTEWGDAINFDGPNNGPVREFFLANAGYWIEEFHLDGLRLDATQNVYDTSGEHILSAITRTVRAAAKTRATFIVAENEPQQTRLVRPREQGGFGVDALWNDDFHHSAMVALTGRNEAYYTDYLGRPQELISAMKWGYLYQGQRYQWQNQRRGTPALDLPPARFISFIQNHDQVANSGRGERVHQLTSPGRYRAMTALLLLGPATPLLFQGQEFAASTPFLYFADHKGALASSVQKGRAQYLAQFPSLGAPESHARMPEPPHAEPFRRSLLDLRERHGHAESFALHCYLLRLRRSDHVFCAPRPRGGDGAVLGLEFVVLRFFSSRGHHEDRLLIVNLGVDLPLRPAPDPLLAPPEGHVWRLLWSSEDPRYGGQGTAPPELEGGWHIPGHAALVMQASPRGDAVQEKVGET